MWIELTKKREGAERFVMTGLVFALVGAAFGVWALLMTDDAPSPLALTFVIVGLMIAAVAAIVGARSRRQ